MEENYTFFLKIYTKNSLLRGFIICILLNARRLSWILSNVVECG